MKILQLQAQGFRSLKDVVWKPGDLNVVIGPNGAGKSNLLRLLELISVAAQGTLSKYIQAAGGIEPLLWDGQADRVSLRLKTSPIDSGRDFQSDSITYELSLARLGLSSSYRVERELLGNFSLVESGQKLGPFKLLERQALRARIFDENERALIAPEESVLEEETLLSLSAGPFANNRQIPKYQRDVAGWSVYHDFHVNSDAPIRQPVVSRLEQRVASDAQNLVNVLHTLYTGDREFVTRQPSAIKIREFGAC